MGAEIGTTEEGMAALAAMETAVPEPKFSYQPWSESIRLDDNTVRGVGYPQASWTWGYLEPEWYDELRAFCPGASAHVFIATKLNDDTFDSFEADMIWPKDDLRNMGLRPNITIEFRNLVAL